MESLEENNGVVKTELQPLILPEGISEDELPKVIINILLRRALFEINPLSKWVLLGALEVLQGRTPKLTATMLSQLVNISQQSEKCNLLSKKSTNNQQCSKINANSVICETVGIQVDMLNSKQFEDKSSQVSIVATTRDIDVQCEPLTHSKEVQCEPSTRTNWAQTLMKPKLVTNWSQTPVNQSKTNNLPQNAKTDSKTKSKEDEDDNVKHKKRNGDVDNYSKHHEGKVDVAETAKYRKSNGDADNKNNLDAVDTLKHKKMNENASNSLKHNRSKGVEEGTPKHKRSMGDLDNSSKHSKSKGDAENGNRDNSSKHCKSKEDGDNFSWDRELVEVDGVPKQRKQVNRLKLTDFERKIPLCSKAKLQDPRLQKYK